MPVEANDGPRDALTEEEVDHTELLSDRHLRRARTAVSVRPSCQNPHRGARWGIIGLIAACFART